PMAPPAADTELTLTLPADALRDSFGNTAPTDFKLTFPWPTGDEVLFDDTPPRLEQVFLRAGHLDLVFSEEPDLAGAGAALQIDGQSVGWILEEDRYTLRTAVALELGSHQLTVGTTPLDLAGHGLAEPFEIAFEVHEVPEECPPDALCATTSAPALLYEAPDPREISTSAAGNDFGFHGLQHDPETGFVYMRNRYYDPELGRFISADPLGYVDGPSLYGFAGGDPLNKSDPMGLYEVDFHYYVVYYMAYLAFDDVWRAEGIASASQLVDDYGLTSPGSLREHMKDPGPYVLGILQPFHFAAMFENDQFGLVTKDNPLVRHIVARAMESTGPQGDAQLGVALHTYADSFSHEGFVGTIDERNRRNDGEHPILQRLDPLGHLHAAHDVDQPFKDPEKAAEAAIQIYQIVRRYAEREGNPKRGRLTWEQLDLLQRQLAAAFRAFDATSSKKRARLWKRFMEQRGIYTLAYYPSSTTGVRLRHFEQARRRQILVWLAAQRGGNLQDPVIPRASGGQR
ncbi:MAG: RHS repeat-associated core domain-containing protein, partial [Thermoanaerobaculia bacterium]